MGLMDWEDYLGNYTESNPLSSYTWMNKGGGVQDYNAYTQATTNPYNKNEKFKSYSTYSVPWSEWETPVDPAQSYLNELQKWQASNEYFNYMKTSGQIRDFLNSDQYKTNPEVPFSKNLAGYASVDPTPVPDQYKNWKPWSGVASLPQVEHSGGLMFSVLPGEARQLGWGEGKGTEGTFLLNPDDPNQMVKVANDRASFIPTDQYGNSLLNPVAEWNKNSKPIEDDGTINTYDPLRDPYNSGDTAKTAQWYSDNYFSQWQPSYGFRWMPALTMAALGAMTGGAASIAGAPAIAAGVIGGATTGVDQAVQKGNVIPMATGAAIGAVAGGVSGTLSNADKLAANTAAADAYAANNVGNVFYGTEATPYIGTQAAAQQGAGYFGSSAFPQFAVSSELALTPTLNSLNSYSITGAAPTPEEYAIDKPKKEPGQPSAFYGTSEYPTLLESPFGLLTKDLTSLYAAKTDEQMLKDKLKDVATKQGMKGLVSALTPSISASLANYLGNQKGYNALNYATTGNNWSIPEVEQAQQQMAQAQITPGTSGALSEADPNEGRFKYLRDYITDISGKPNYLVDYIA